MNIDNERIIEIARENGFDLVGFSKADEMSQEVERLEKWLGDGYHAGMEYMTRNLDKKLDVRKILASAESVISLAVNYYNSKDFSGKENTGKVSRYAWGRDYHYVIGDMLEKFIEEIKEIDDRFIGVPYVDTGPVMDKAWAVKGGIGWLGKHTNVISKDIGSWFFIATIITNFEFSYPVPIADHCGTCTACIEACPTDAIAEEYLLDSNKCISYLTIENKNEIPNSFKGSFDNWLFGCDICQDVCPWNIKYSCATLNEEFLDTPNRELNLYTILEMENSEFKRRFEESPIKRAKLKGLKRNALHLI